MPQRMVNTANTNATNDITTFCRHEIVSFLDQEVTVAKVVLVIYYYAVAVILII